MTRAFSIAATERRVGELRPDTEAIALASPADQRLGRPRPHRRAGGVPPEAGCRSSGVLRLLLNRTDASLRAETHRKRFSGRSWLPPSDRRASMLCSHRATAPRRSRRPRSGDRQRGVSEILLRVGAAPVFSGLAAALDAPVQPDSPSSSSGSNAWAVARSPAGGPWLAVDPHRLIQTPSLRYLVHLRAPGWHVAGASAPWMPGVAIGHNERVAWAATAASLDTQDIYVEQLNP